jgi:hypothetical protein
MFGWFKKKEEIVKQKQTKITLVELESKYEKYNRISGYYLIKFLTHDDKIMEYKEEFSQAIPFARSPDIVGSLLRDKVCVTK